MSLLNSFSCWLERVGICLWCCSISLSTFWGVDRVAFFLYIFCREAFWVLWEKANPLVRLVIFTNSTKGWHRNKTLLLRMAPTLLPLQLLIELPLCWKSSGKSCGARFHGSPTTFLLLGSFHAPLLFPIDGVRHLCCSSVILRPVQRGNLRRSQRYKLVLFITSS